MVANTRRPRRTHGLTRRIVRARAVYFPSNARCDAPPWRGGIARRVLSDGSETILALDANGSCAAAAAVGKPSSPTDVRGVLRSSRSGAGLHLDRNSLRTASLLVQRSRPDPHGVSCTCATRDRRLLVAAAGRHRTRRDRGTETVRGGHGLGTLACRRRASGLEHEVTRSDRRSRRSVKIPASGFTNGRRYGSRLSLFATTALVPRRRTDASGPSVLTSSTRHRLATLFARNRLHRHLAAPVVFAARWAPPGSTNTRFTSTHRFPCRPSRPSSPARIIHGGALYGASPDPLSTPLRRRRYRLYSFRPHATVAVRCFLFELRKSRRPARSCSHRAPGSNAGADRPARAFWNDPPRLTSRVTTPLTDPAIDHM